MTITCSTFKPQALASKTRLQPRAGGRLLRCLTGYLRGPAIAPKPPGLRVSDRMWRRNGALLMSLYEQDRQ